MSDPTAVFSIYDERDREIRAVVQEVYDALKEKGYNPINQLVGYILSEDPTYITTYKNARSLIRKVDRDELLDLLDELRAQLPVEIKRAQELLALWRGLDSVDVLATPDLNVVCVEWWESEAASHAAVLRADALEGYNEGLKALFAADIKKNAHDVKTLLSRLLDEGIAGEGFVFDTALAAYLLAPTDGSYELEKLGMTYFNQEFPKAKDTYLAADAFTPLADQGAVLGALMSHTALIGALKQVLAPRLEELGMHDLYYGVELPLCPVLAEMEHLGMLVDRQALAAFGALLDERIRADEALIYELAGETFNVNSTQQFGHILFDKLGLPPVKKTKTGYSTSAEVLDKLRGRHPIVEAVLDYRQLAKLKSTYVDGLTKVIAADCFKKSAEMIFGNTYYLG